MDYFHNLYEVVKAVNSSLEPKTVLSRIAEKAAWAMQAKACSIRLLSQDKTSLNLGATYGLSQGYLRKGPVEVSKSGIDQEVLSGRNVFIGNACEDPRFQYPEAARNEGIVSILAVPLKLLGKESIGVLRVYLDTEREFSDEEIEFANAMAEVCALAIKNAYDYNKVKYEHELFSQYAYQLFED